LGFGEDIGKLARKKPQIDKGTVPRIIAVMLMEKSPIPNMNTPRLNREKVRVRATL